MDMDMQSSIPDWLTPVAWAYITLALITTAVLAADIYLGRRRHGDVASELVWVTSGLYLGPFALPVYLNRGRVGTASTPSDLTGNRTDASRSLGDESRGSRDGSAVAVLPGGGASAVAHLIAVPIVAALGWTIAGLAMWPMIIVIAVLATVLLAAYERRAAHKAIGRGRVITLSAAFLGALVTVAAFDVGMVGWMLLLHFNDAMPPVSDGTFWFLMQVGVIVGLATGYPAVKWLLGRNPSIAPA